MSTVPPANSVLDALTADLTARFSATGNDLVTVPHLFPGDMLLDLYGEDLRGRAFMVQDGAHRPELCLRPDFTVPVVLEHRVRGWETAAGYVCAGNVFRKQAQPGERPAEYLQVGVERIGFQDRLAEDADVFTWMVHALKAHGIEHPQATIGDLAIVFALLDAIEMPERRRADLRRHVWRPDRFQALLKRFQAEPPASETRIDLLNAADLTAAAQSRMFEAREPIGARTPGDVIARLDRLQAAADDPAMPAEDARLIADLLAIRCPVRDAPDALQSVLAPVTNAMTGVLEMFGKRLEMIAAAGVDLDLIAFDAAFGRSLEYYDGFVFELRMVGKDALPPLAAGGRYDAMTRQLGAPQAIPAVGAMIRPEAVIEALK
jgi:ATP phosphoribosyltransferase regulatory subunit